MTAAVAYAASSNSHTVVTALRASSPTLARMANTRAARLVTPLLLAACAAPAGATVDAPTLVGRAVLPAATFAEGPPSGASLGVEPIHGQTPPFASQPVQGFSALVRGDDETYLALPDNGYGAIENSADFHLRVYTLRLDPRTEAGGGGSVEVAPFFELRDPDGQIDFPIVQHFSAERVLTGADFDVESMQRGPDGTLWFGDEFGPFLLHTSADGVVLEPPIRLPDADHPGQELRAPQNPYNEEGAALRIMHALRWRAAQRGATRPPVFSPYHVMLVDGDAGVGHYARDDTPQPGLTKASSEVFDPVLLRKAGFPVVTWTVNEAERMRALLTLGVDGIISDRPDLLLAELRAFDGDGDGKPDYLDADGLIDRARFDAQGHRGARDLRPENTLPAMEAALDNLVTTLETDFGLTVDEVPLLSHDPYLEATKCRRGDGAAYEEAEQLLIRERTAAELQATFVCDRPIRGPEQTNDRELSPVATAFASAEQLPDPYTPATLAQLFRFVDAYVAHYESGPGESHPEAASRAANARRVRFNVETKINPRRDEDRHGRVYAERTLGPDRFADRVIAEIAAAGLEDRVDVQSFDFRPLLRVQDQAPGVRTVFLFGDFPIYDDPQSDDGTNLQDENGATSPWLAGLPWPYRVTAATQPLAIQTSGGFEGMALRADPPALLPMLEKPLVGAPAGELLIHVFDLTEKTFTGDRWRYTMDERGVGIGDFQLDADGRGLVIERDASEGDVNGLKVVQAIDLGESGGVVTKQPLVDLLALADPHGVAPEQAGDVGVGGGMFALPFVTIESLVILGEDRLLIANDNNFPFGVGRHTGTMQPDDNEMVFIALPPG